MTVVAGVNLEHDNMDHLHASPQLLRTGLSAGDRLDKFKQ